MSFLAPLGLLLGLLGIPLAALYFLKFRRRRVEVPSVLLWQAFARSEQLATPFQRFRRNLLLLLQLLLLALLVLAFARPFTEAEVARFRSVVLVVDTTASMGATDVSPSRLAVAVDRAGRTLDGMGITDEAMLVVVGPQVEVAVPFTRDEAEVRAALGRLRPTEAEGSLREGLQLALSLARSRNDVEVVVLSDGSQEDLGDLPSGGVEVQLYPVGRSADNAGIVALDLRASPSSDLDRQLFVTVANFGPDEVQGSAEVYLDGELLGLRAEPLPAGDRTSMVFDVPGGRSGTLQVVLDSPGDQLSVDDEAWAVVSPASTRKVLLVDGDLLTARALASDPRVDLHLAPSSAVTAQVLSEVDCTVFAGPVPAGVDGHHYAVLGPHPGSPVVFGDEVRGVDVLGWRRSHPVLRFVEWDPVVIARAREVEDSAGLVSVVDGLDGPLVLAGERGGGRVVQLAFDPLQSDLPLRVAWPVLVLNTVGWLTEEAAGASGAQLLPTGAPWVRRLPAGTDPEGIQVEGPGGDQVDLAVVDDLLRVRGTERVGIYEVDAGTVQARFAANLLSERESDIAPRQELTLGGGATTVEQASVVGRRELWRPLVWLALALLLVEWVVYHRRRSP